MKTVLLLFALLAPTAYADRDPIECHEMAMDRAKRNGSDLSTVFDLMNDGSEHLALLAKCGNDKCRMERLARACSCYCDAVGTFASLITDDHTSDMYRDVYWKFVDVTTHCDSAERMATSGAWFNVPFFLESMEQAFVEIEAWAIDHE